jgi:hypothetical protein
MWEVLLSLHRLGDHEGVLVFDEWRRRVRQSLQDRGAAVHSYYHIGLAPYWARIRAGVHADLAARTRDLAHVGLGKVLSGIHPQSRWQPPVLEIPYADDQDLRLDGRGLQLIPSFFCWGDRSPSRTRL